MNNNANFGKINKIFEAEGYSENILAVLKKQKNLERAIAQTELIDVISTSGVDDMDLQYLNKTVNFNIKIPKVHKGYYFPTFSNAILNRVKAGRNTMITGGTGCGKTQFVDSLAQLVGQKLIRVNFSVGTTEQHLIGKWIVKNGQTEFVYGIVPLAMKYGWWLLFDEIDFAMPEHMAILQPILEGNPLIITQNKNEELVPHENFRVFATGNTKGRGDESQAYVGTGNLNLAFLDRWAIFEMDYTNKEIDIVKNIISDDELSKQIITYFKILRKTADDGAIINAVFSTRRLIQLAEALEFGESLKEALRYEIFSRYDKHEIDILKEISYDIWDKEHYMKGWKVGDDHYVPPIIEDPTQATEDPNKKTAI